MKTIKVQISVEGPEILLPGYATALSSGLDLQANCGVVLKAYMPSIVSTGLKIAIPSGYEGQIRSRSGLSLKGVIVLNSPGTIDADYRGELKIIMINLNPNDFVIKKGDRIAQLVFAEVARVSWDLVAELTPTTRGSGGFGSTGI